MSRDLRDPQKVGEIYLRLRKAKFTIDEAVLAAAPDLAHNPSCIEKYGKADEVKEVWERIQIK